VGFLHGGLCIIWPALTQLGAEENCAGPASTKSGQLARAEATDLSGTKIKPS
jgi:hypothetical protein